MVDTLKQFLNSDLWTIIQTLITGGVASFATVTFINKRKDNRPNINNNFYIQSSGDKQNISIDNKSFQNFLETLASPAPQKKENFVFKGIRILFSPFCGFFGFISKVLRKKILSTSEIPFFFFTPSRYKYKALLRDIKKRKLMRELLKDKSNFLIYNQENQFFGIVFLLVFLLLMYITLSEFHALRTSDLSGFELYAEIFNMFAYLIYGQLCLFFGSHLIFYTSTLRKDALAFSQFCNFVSRKILVYLNHEKGAQYLRPEQIAFLKEEIEFDISKLQINTELIAHAPFFMRWHLNRYRIKGFEDSHQANKNT